MEKTRVILVANKGTDRIFYLHVMKEWHVQVDAVSTFKQLEKKMLKIAYQGVLVDLKTKIRDIKRDKELAHQILEQFPVVQLRLDAETQEVRALYYGKSKGDGTLKDFIQKDCRFFDARKLRAYPRAQIHLNVTLLKTDDFSDQRSVRTVTTDISKGGCFLFATEEFDFKQRVYVRFEDLSDPAPVTGEVRWSKPWGQALQLPGIGVKFDTIPDRLLSEICAVANITL